MKEIRCKKCGKLLFKVSEESSTYVEIKCLKCGSINKIKQ